MDYRSVSAAHRASGADSDRSTTLDSLKDLMAFSQRPSRARHDDILFAAKNARAQMPAHFREPPSSTGSHGTITTSSIHVTAANSKRSRHGRHDGGNHNDDLTSDSVPSSTFSIGPDAESTRASLYYERGSHHARRSTGRFGHGGRDDGNRDVLTGIVNTSALFRTFKEWKPDTEMGIYEDEDADAASTTNMAALGDLARFDQENCAPLPSSPPVAAVTAQYKPKKGPLADAPVRRSRSLLQATVQNESDLSAVLSTAAQKPQKPQAASSLKDQNAPKPQPASARSQASPLRTTSGVPPRTAAPAHGLRKSATVGTIRGTGVASPPQPPSQPVDFEQPSPLLDEFSSPETSADSPEDAADAPVMVSKPTVASAPTAAGPMSRVVAATTTKTDSHDGATNQSFIVPSKSFPLLHNLVTGTLRFTPGTYFYGATADAQRKHKLPPGPIPADEQDIFVDMENIREEVIRLQEHDEMLQNEIIQGEAKYKALLDRFYGLAHRSADLEGAVNLEQPYKESQEQNRQLQNRIRELETALGVMHKQYEEALQASATTAAERDAAVARASAAAETSRRLAADGEAMRERLATSSQRPSQEAQRRIQQLEQMVAERERVIKALRDERDAAASSHREACRMYQERIARTEAEKKMLGSDHAKCADERYALTTAKDALAQKNTTLRDKMHAVRRQHKDREATVYAVVDRQRTQIARLQALLRDKEKSVLQLDENFRKLRASWSAKDETLLRMHAVLDQWPGAGAGVTVSVKSTGDMTRDFDVDSHDFASQGGDGLDDDLDRDDDPASHPSGPHQEQPDDLDDGTSDSGQSAVDHSMDENMTSAFIIPDLEFQTEDAGSDAGDAADADGRRSAHADLGDDPELAHDLAQIKQATEAAARSKTASKTGQSAKSVTFETDTRTKNKMTTTATATADTSVCRHNRVNCVVCCQNAGPVNMGEGEHDKVTVAVPRPILDRAADDRQTALPDASMDPGSALAYVMKMLDDERRHLWMQIRETRRHGEAAEALNDQQRPRRTLREAEALWNSYVRKVEQLNRLDDVLEGQRAAGQDMTREEIDVTITRILEM